MGLISRASCYPEMNSRICASAELAWAIRIADVRQVSLSGNRRVLSDLEQYVMSCTGLSRMVQ
jgi:hypothetical protein